MNVTMNMIILKATLLFTSVLVNSHPIPEQATGSFDDVKSFIIKDSVSENDPSDCFNTQNQVTLSAWKPGISLPSGTYALYLVNPPYFELKVAELEYHVNEHKDWVRIPKLEWVDIPRDDLNSWALLLQGINIDTNDRKYLPSSAIDWTYNILVKTVRSSGQPLC